MFDQLMGVCILHIIVSLIHSNLCNRSVWFDWIVYTSVQYYYKCFNTTEFTKLGCAKIDFNRIETNRDCECNSMIMKNSQPPKNQSVEKLVSQKSLNQKISKLNFWWTNFFRPMNFWF